MNYLGLEEVKRQLNIDADYHEEDEYLMSLAEVAQRAVENHLDCPLERFEDEDGQIEPPIRQAMLLEVGTLYQNRESVSFSQGYAIPHSFEYLLQPYVQYGHAKPDEEKPTLS